MCPTTIIISMSPPLSRAYKPTKLIIIISHRAVRRRPSQQQQLQLEARYRLSPFCEFYRVAPVAARAGDCR